MHFLSLMLTLVVHTDTHAAEPQVTPEVPASRPSSAPSPVGSEVQDSDPQAAGGETDPESIDPQSTDSDSTEMDRGSESAPGPAETTEETRETRGAARSLRDEAFQELAAERYAEGIEKLKEAYKKIPNPGFLLNISIAYRRWKGHCAEAFQAFSAFNAVCNEDCEFEAEAKDHAEALKNACTSPVRVESEPPTRVRLDGSVLGPTPLELRLRPGRYTIGAGDTEVGLDVDGETAHRLNLVLSEPPPGPPKRRPWAWVAVGGSAAALVGGIALTALAADSAGELMAAEQDGAEPDVVDALRSRRNRETALAVAAWSTALVGAGAATWLLLRRPPEPD